MMSRRPQASRRRTVARPDAGGWHGRPLATALIAAFLAVVIAVAGGASRPDVFGQVIVRVVSLLSVVALAIVGSPVDWGRARVMFAFLAAMAFAVMLQSIPLPPGLWEALPGRSILREVAATTGTATAWRPIASVPDGAINALLSLIVPVSVLFAIASLAPAWQRRLPLLVIGIATVSGLVGLIQLAGNPAQNPFINDSIGAASGLLANRNHQALLLAIGMAVTAGWGLEARDASPLRFAVAAMLVAFFLLLIMATGSRAGLISGAIALLVVAIVHGARLRKLATRVSRRTLLIGSAVVAGCLVLLAITATQSGRDVAFQRLFSGDVADDMRTRSFPVVLRMIADSFPFGWGYGSFDPIFRMYEPDSLLKRTYFNAAHDDVLQVVLEGGIASLALLAAFVLWWVRCTLAWWRMPASPDTLWAGMGIGILAMVIVASISDYPARTPVMMAVLIVAAWWASGGGRARDAASSPD